MSYVGESAETVLASLKKGFRHGFGILALQFTTGNTLWSGGHDGVLRCWDLREVRNHFTLKFRNEILRRKQG